MAWQFPAGEILTADNLNAVTKPWDAICIVQENSQSINDATLTVVSFTDAEVLDPRDWHSTGTNPERVTPDIAGTYKITAASRLVTAANDIARIILQPTKNGSDITVGNVDIKPDTSSGNSQMAVTTTVWVELNGSTDYVGVSSYQDNTGGNARATGFWLMVELVYPS